MQNYYSGNIDKTKYYDNETQHYQFISPECNDKSKGILKPFIYYQIAGFKNFKTNLYDIRRIIINENNEIVDFKNNLVSKKIYKEIKKTIPSNLIKIYPVDTLFYIDLPRTADISIARSCLLS